MHNKFHGYETALKGFEETLKNTGMEYVDLYLIHWPLAKGREKDWKNLHRQTWKAFEKIYRDGKARAIGISNFTVEHMTALAEVAEISPHVNQIEAHPYYVPQDIIDYCDKHRMLIEAWAPLIKGKAMSDPLLLEIASKYDVTVAQVCIRWSVQMGFIPLPKSDKPERIKNNGDIFGFEISAEDMERIATLKVHGREFHDPNVYSF